jgi:hypothetical protein
MLPLVDGEVHFGVIPFLTGWELAEVFKGGDALLDHNFWGR